MTPICSPESNEDAAVHIDMSSEHGSKYIGGHVDKTDIDT